MLAFLARLFLLLLLGCDWYAGPADEACGLSPTSRALAATDVACASLDACSRTTPSAQPQLPAADFLAATVRPPASQGEPLPPAFLPLSPPAADLIYVVMSLRR